MATPLIAFYTVFCGKDHNIANRVPEVPSKDHDCYFYTNNQTTGERAKAQGWIVIPITKESMDDELADCLDAKHVKVCPHLYPELMKYEYTCFCDSKARVWVEKVLHLLKTVPKPFIVQRHWFLLYPHVEAEYQESMKQPRYVRQKDQYRAYINKQVALGLAPLTKNHLACSFILRNMRHPRVTQLNELWWQHIGECGIQDQISFFFVKQHFDDIIHPIELADKPFTH